MHSHSLTRSSQSQHYGQFGLRYILFWALFCADSRVSGLDPLDSRNTFCIARCLLEGKITPGWIPLAWRTASAQRLGGSIGRCLKIRTSRVWTAGKISFPKPHQEKWNQNNANSFRLAPDYISMCMWRQFEQCLAHSKLKTWASVLAFFLWSEGIGLGQSDMSWPICCYSSPCLMPVSLVSQCYLSTKPKKGLRILLNRTL